MTQEIIETPPPGIAPVEAFNVEGLIAKAIEKKVSVDTMERILTMRRELKAEFAKEAFDQALAAFQANCPVIAKTKQVNDKSGKPRYKYAPIESIVEQVKPHLQEHGFSYTITTKTEDNKVTAIVKATHSQGHSELSDFTIPIDPAAFMNEQQKFASALTFAKRYAFCNAFGILTGDEDDDSQNAGEPQQKFAVKPAKEWQPVVLSDATLDFIAFLEATDTIEEYNNAYKAISEAKAIGAITNYEYKKLVAVAKETVQRIQKKIKETPSHTPTVVEAEVVEPKEKTPFAKAVERTSGAKFVH